MNILLSVIIATMAIAAMIAIRIYVFQRALEERLKARRSGTICDTTPCFRGCGSGEPEPPADSVIKPQQTEKEY